MPKNKTDTEILTMLEDHFRESVRDPSWKNFLTNAVKVSRYRENEQWTTAEIHELVEVRRQPLYINNQVKVTIDYLNGQFAQLKTRIGLRPRNKADQRSADTYTDLFRFIAQNNGLEFVEREAADDGFTVGRGVIDVQVEFDDLFQPEIKISAEDALSVHPDPHSKHYDWNEDALYICRSKWVDVDKAIELYPKHKVRLQGLLSGGEDPAEGDLTEKDALELFKETDLIDTQRNRLRLVEVEYKHLKRETIWLAEDEIIHEDDIKESVAKRKGYQRLDRITHKIYMGVFTSGLLLSHEETEKERFSTVQFIVHRKKSGEPYGPTFAGLPLQDSINKRGSKAMHLLNSRGVIYERGAITDKDGLAAELAKPDFQVELNDGKMENFTFVENRELANAHMAFHDSDLANFRRVTGVNPDALGEKTEIRSGIGVARKVAQTQTVTAGAFDNFRRTQQALGLTILDCVQHYYTPRKIELVTDDTEAAQTIELDPDTLAAMKQAKYDMVITEVPNLVNTEAEQFQILAQMIPQMAQTSPFWARMLLKTSQLPEKDKLIKMLDDLPKGPQIQPKMTISAQLDNMSPVERAYLYKQMGAAEVAQAVLQENRPPSDMLKLQGEQMKLQGAMAKIQAEIQQSQLELQTEQASAQLKLQVEQQQAQAETIKAKLEIVLAQLELEKQRLEIEKAELAVEKAEVDVEKSESQANLAEKRSKESKKSNGR